MLHDAMLTAGYKPERGDTWIVNEVGSPSDSTVNTDVFNGVAGARQGFRDFIRGLYTGSSGPVLPGMVFAADAAQLAPDVPDYAQKLASWYADTPFWEDMQRYVSVWAQETYADARAWGVAGAPLDGRSGVPERLLPARAAGRGRRRRRHRCRPRLLRWGVHPARERRVPVGATEPRDGDQLRLHGHRGDRDAAVHLCPDARNALVAGDPVGFAVVPRNDVAAERAAIQARVAAAIRDSQSDPIGACTAPGESCDFDVAGAEFTETWRGLANTQEGANVQVQLGVDVAVRFDEVGARGATWFSSSATADGPAGWAADEPDIRDRHHRDHDGAGTGLPRGAMGHVFQRSDAGWRDVTSSPGWARPMRWATFARFVDPTPPVLVPHIKVSWATAAGTPATSR